MKYIIALLLLVAGCATQTVGPSADVMDGHIGCQEGEMDEDGACTVAESNNAGAFETAEGIETRQIDGGYIARPAEEGDYPGIVMIHEWWGLNDNIKDMADTLATEGYVVYAVDLYGGQVAEDSTKARELAMAARSNPDLAVADMQEAVAYLRDMEGVTKVGSLGWCFGGQHSLLLSMNEDLDATVIYYGSLVDDKEQLGSIDWPVLGIFGEEDSSIPVSSVRSFEASLDELGVENDIYIYPGVGHAFANPSGTSYAPEETMDAWEKTTAFLDANLK